ncbi:hypothetical protein PPERSA_07749 [Pseudocohnilembus persalinus]|uniref:Transmembrane protein n=1 Tax=Pseudocohnilembus persalinus TaxID=266149 RepID=A0A0V0RAJ1_PSEPJ|nr:hypothetical protein PPERSA_07749 [Pseudocohnilembus persalinus]|eukprot:KRX11224.1 hypothetical protein PPERSA_07749 [Pseudocohnilembus persalinus]
MALGQNSNKIYEKGRNNNNYGHQQLKDDYNCYQQSYHNTNSKQDKKLQLQEIKSQSQSISVLSPFAKKWTQQQNQSLKDLKEDLRVLSKALDKSTLNSQSNGFFYGFNDNDYQQQSYQNENNFDLLQIDQDREQMTKKWKEKLDLYKKEAFLQLKAASQNVQSNFNNLQKELQKVIDKNKLKLKEYFKKKVQIQIEKILIKSRPKVKNYLKDPDMPESIQDVVDDVVDENWELLQNNIMSAIDVAEIKEENIMDGANKKRHWCCQLNIFYHLQRFYLYTMQPYDRSFWWQIRQPQYYLFQLLKLVSYLSINNFFYVLIFLAINKRDEWQLIRYILEFKAFQFLSVGCISTIRGMLQFYFCASLNNYQNENDLQRCERSGPKAELYDSIGFFLIIFMCWLSFLFLQCAENKGKWKDLYVKHVKDDYVRNKEHKCFCCTFTLEKGGRLKGFMLYDLFVVIFCALLFVVMYIFLDKQEEWQVKQILYLVKTIYGMLMFPFMLFVIPQFNEILTRSKETGYDKYANCLPRFIDADNMKAKLQKQFQENLDDENLDVLL